jgi:hypothetical protein
MTLTAPNGAKVRTRSKWRYAVVYGWSAHDPENFSNLVPAAKCIKRSDEIRVAQRAARQFALGRCYIYDTETKERVS